MLGINCGLIDNCFVFDFKLLSLLIILLWWRPGEKKKKLLSFSYHQHFSMPGKCTQQREMKILHGLKKTAIFILPHEHGLSVFWEQEGFHKIQAADEILWAFCVWIKLCLAATFSSTCFPPISGAWLAAYEKPPLSRKGREEQSEVMKDIWSQYWWGNTSSCFLSPAHECAGLLFTPSTPPGLCCWPLKCSRCALVFIPFYLP